MSKIELGAFEALVPRDHGLCVAVTRRADATPHATVVNGGVIDHPVGGGRVAAFVAAGTARKLAHLRADPTVALTIRAGWQWTTVEGQAELIGPDDPHPQVSDDRLRLLVREVFRAAGGSHDDWDEFDRVMGEERRAAVLVRPTRLYSNPGG